VFQIIRRGQQFLINVSFERNFNINSDIVELVFEIGKIIKDIQIYIFFNRKNCITQQILVSSNSFKYCFTGDNPKESKNTLCILSSDCLKSRDWKCDVTEVSDKDVALSVTTSCSCIVGKWNMFVHTKLKVG
jgi:hypothetical protein